jgi:hypothetical protein
MGKRFRDTEIWSKPWFRKMPPAMKVAWDFILDRCDAVGVWVPDFEAAEFHIGAKVDWEGLKESANGNIVTLACGKWWIKDFCRFQYGKICPDSESKVQKSMHSLLLGHGLWESYADTVSHTVSHTVQDKEKEKDKEKVKEKDTYGEGIVMEKAHYSALVNQYGEKVVKIAIEKVAAQQIKTKKRYANPRGAILQWGIRAALEEIKKGGGPAQAEDRCPECGVSGGAHGVTCSRLPR